MSKKFLLFVCFFLVICIITLAFYHLTSNKPKLSSIESVHASTAVVIDTDLSDTKITNAHIAEGITPVLVFVENRNNVPVVTVIKTVDALLQLDNEETGAITPSNPRYFNLGVAYFPVPKSSGFFSRKPEAEKVIITLLHKAGIRGIFFDPGWIPEEHRSHPNFRGAVGFAIMSDNTKRPIKVIDTPANIVDDVQNPAKYLLVQ